MKLIKPSYTILEQESGLEGIYKAIERAGRVCYRSEDKITEDSAKPFVDRMINSQHYAMLEHGTVYLKIPNDKLLRNFIDGNPSHFNYGWCRTNSIMDEDNNVYITTNYRHIIEHKLEDYLKYLCEPTEFHEKRICVHFIADIGVIREFFRHRVFSMAQESTRYCNYSKSRFNSELTFIQPCWISDSQNNISLEDMDICGDSLAEMHFKQSLILAEQSYFRLLKEGWKPQQARAVLPLSLKSEAIMTGFVSDWQHLCRLRSSFAETGQPHPDMKALVDPLLKEFISRGYLEPLV